MIKFFAIIFLAVLMVGSCWAAESPETGTQVPLQILEMAKCLVVLDFRIATASFEITQTTASGHEMALQSEKASLLQTRDTLLKLAENRFEPQHLLVLKEVYMRFRLELWSRFPGFSPEQINELGEVLSGVLDRCRNTDTIRIHAP